MRINVTAEHIRDGDRNVPNKHAVALALRERLKGRQLYVYTSHFEDLTAGRSYPLPKEARNALVPSSKALVPFSFEIEDVEGAA